MCLPGIEVRTFGRIGSALVLNYFSNAQKNHFCIKKNVKCTGITQMSIFIYSSLVIESIAWKVVSGLVSLVKYFCSF